MVDLTIFQGLPLGNLDFASACRRPYVTSGRLDLELVFKGTALERDDLLFSVCDTAPACSLTGCT